MTSYKLCDMLSVMNKFDTYLNLLLEWNSKMNLTAITDPDEIRVKHFADSLTCLDTGYINDGDSLVDVGTGAGFPGLPIRIINDSIKLTLIDSLNKRVNFLKAVCNELKIDADCVHIRAEDAGKSNIYRERFDISVSRAVANMSVLSEYNLPLVRVGGYFLAMKGKEIEDELNAAKSLIKQLGGEVREVQIHQFNDAGGTCYTHSIVIIQKTAATPDKFPRSAKNIGKNNFVRFF